MATIDAYAARYIEYARSHQSGTPHSDFDLSSLRFPLGSTVEAVEKELILQTLAATNNKTRAAELLGISLKTLHNKLKEYESEAPGVGGDKPPRHTEPQAQS
jgi:DNA-binding NtrC family response regulator